MAIYGKDSIIEHVRSMGLVYWRVYQNQQDKNSGNYVGSADFNNEQLGTEASLEALRTCLNRLTAGQYLLSVYRKPGDSKGGINSNIEIEGNANGSISGIGSTGPAFHMEGIGAITADNFEVAVEKKMQKMMDDQKEKEEKAALQKEVVELKRQVRENETGINQGLLSIGSVLYATMSKSPTGKEFIGMVKDIFFKAKAAERTTTPGTGETDNIEDAEVIGSPTTEEERLLVAVEKLSKDNPDFLQQIEMMAKVKENDPATFKDGIEALKTFAG